jgi:hypothetical protein
VREGVDRHPGPQHLEHLADIDGGWLEQLLTQRATELGDPRLEVKLGLLQQYLACQREAVAVDAAAG